MKKVLLFAAALLSLSAMLFAQTPDAGVAVFDPNFFTALVCGIILAFGFQLILTNLAVAGGLSVLHAPLQNVKEDIEDKGKPGHDAAHDKDKQHDKGEEKKGVHTTVRNVNRAFGIYALIATSVSLFFAGWLAVRLSGNLTSMIGVIIGLSIWGLLYVLNLTLEMRAVSSLTGSLMSLAGSGLKGIADTAGGIFGKSDEKKAGDTAAEIAASVRDEIFHDVNLKKEIHKYIDAIKPDYSEMRKQFEGVLSNARVETTTHHEAPEEEKSTAEVHVGAPTMQETGTAAKAAASKIQDVKGKVQGEMQSDKDMTSKVADSAMEVAGLSREQAEVYRTKVEDYLRNTGKDELNPEGIKRDLEQLFRDPKGGFEAIKERIGNIDSSTISSLLSQRKDINPDEANNVVSWVTKTLDEIKGKYHDTVDSAKEKTEGMAGGVETKVRDYMDSLNRPELKYQDIKGDFELLFHDPKAGADAIISRMKSLDRDTLKAVIASRKDISEEDAENMVSKMEEARDSMIERAERMKDMIQEKVREIEEEAVHQADEVRKTAASAAWWVFASAVVSGAAAALGGWIGTMV